MGASKQKRAAQEQEQEEEVTTCEPAAWEDIERYLPDDGPPEDGPPSDTPTLDAAAMVFGEEEAFLDQERDAAAADEGGGPYAGRYTESLGGDSIRLLNFGQGSARLRGHHTKALTDLANRLASDPRDRIWFERIEVIEGGASVEGDPCGQNQPLSEARAIEVFDFLETRPEGLAFYDNQPLLPTPTGVGASQQLDGGEERNRRVDVVVGPPVVTPGSATIEDVEPTIATCFADEPVYEIDDGSEFMRFYESLPCGDLLPGDIYYVEYALTDAPAFVDRHPEVEHLRAWFNFDLQTSELTRPVYMPGLSNQTGVFFTESVARRERVTKERIEALEKDRKTTDWSLRTAWSAGVGIEVIAVTGGQGWLRNRKTGQDFFSGMWWVGPSISLPVGITIGESESSHNQVWREAEAKDFDKQPITVFTQGISNMAHMVMQVGGLATFGWELSVDPNVTSFSADGATLAVGMLSVYEPEGGRSVTDD